MIFITAKLPLKRIIAGICAICVIAGAIIFITGNKEDDTGVFQEEDNGYVVTITAKNIKTQEDKIAYITSLGWEIDEDDIQTKTVLIPKEFNGAYEEYNQMQKDQGFNLEKYKGKKVDLTTFKVKNHPKAEDGVVANILVYKDRVIGGDICLERENGFIHGLTEGLEE